MDICQKSNVRCDKQVCFSTTWLMYWLEYQWGSCTHQILSTYLVWSFWGKAFLSCQLYKVKWTGMTFEFDLLTWISIGIIHSTETIYSTYQVWLWSLWDEAFLSYQLHKVRSTGMTFNFDLLTWISTGSIYSSENIYQPSLKLVGQSILKSTVAQGEVDEHDLWPCSLTYWPECQ